MKKIFLTVLSLFLISALNAEGWQKNLEMGIALPISNFYGNGDKIDDKKTDFDMNYVAIRKANKLAIKLNAGAGISKSSELDVGTGNGIRASLAVGYAPVLNEQFTLAIMGNIGFYLSGYGKKTTVAGTKIETDAFFRLGTIGADILGIYHFTNHLGFFTNLGLYMPFCGYLRTKAESHPVSNYFAKTTLYDNKISLNGLIFMPAFGLTWRF